MPLIPDLLLCEQSYRPWVAICSQFISCELSLPKSFPVVFHMPCPPHPRHRVLLSLSPPSFSCARGRRCCGSWAPQGVGAKQPAGRPGSMGRCWARPALAEPPFSTHLLLLAACRKLASIGAEPSGKFTSSSPTDLVHWRGWERQTGSSMVAKACYLYETRVKSGL